MPVLAQRSVWLLVAAWRVICAHSDEAHEFVIFGSMTAVEAMARRLLPASPQVDGSATQNSNGTATVNIVEEKHDPVYPFIGGLLGGLGVVMVLGCLICVAFRLFCWETESTAPFDNIVQAGASVNKIWKVVSGDESGGITVCQGRELTSRKLSNLMVGARVREIKLVPETKGMRLLFEKISGVGPDKGWCSLSSQGQKLLELEDTELLPAPHSPHSRELAPQLTPVQGARYAAEQPIARSPLTARSTEVSASPYRAVGEATPEPRTPLSSRAGTSNEVGVLDRRRATGDPDVHPPPPMSLHDRGRLVFPSNTVTESPIREVVRTPNLRGSISESPLGPISVYAASPQLSTPDAGVGFPDVHNVGADDSALALPPPVLLGSK